MANVESNYAALNVNNTVLRLVVGFLGTQKLCAHCTYGSKRAQLHKTMYT